LNFYFESLVLINGLLLKCKDIFYIFSPYTLQFVILIFMTTFAFTREAAQQMDAQDELKHFRDKFYFPLHKGEKVVYFTGNSLGLQPRTTQDYVTDELEDWASFGVEGHFHARKPWFQYHEFLTEAAAKICGAKNSEVVMMNQLTVNLHLLMVSFYRPDKKRFKILCEAKAFPSDQYALQSQIKFHGFSPAEALLEVQPRSGEFCLREEDILKCIEENKDSLALVMLGGVNYFTGQVFDMKKITAAAHAAGAIAGFDLAHAAGNIELKLHEWNVDFAAWCSYKYLNSGPGAVAGAFVHEKHHNNTNLPLFAGWWGHDKTQRFKMEAEFKPMQSAERWQLSNAPVLSMAAARAAHDLFVEAGLPRLIEKSKILTAYLEFVILEINKELILQKQETLVIITPSERRGCQLSVIAKGRGKDLFQKLIENGIIADWREPNVIRMAPVPLYNSFEDIFRFGKILEHLLLQSN
jgi:kynureninase